MFKMGANHVVRGRSSVEAFDLGTLLHEVAAIEDGHAFSMLVLPGHDSDVAVLDPSVWTHRPGPAKDGYIKPFLPLLEVAGHEMQLFDMLPLRPVLSGARAAVVSPELVRMVHGFDTMLVMGGSTPSTNL